MSAAECDGRDRCDEDERQRQRILRASSPLFRTAGPCGRQRISCNGCRMRRAELRQVCRTRCPISTGSVDGTCLASNQVYRQGDGHGTQLIEHDGREQSCRSQRTWNRRTGPERFDRQRQRHRRRARPQSRRRIAAATRHDVGPGHRCGGRDGRCRTSATRTSTATAIAMAPGNAARRAAIRPKPVDETLTEHDDDGVESIDESAESARRTTLNPTIVPTRTSRRARRSSERRGLNGSTRRRNADVGPRRATPASPQARSASACAIFALSRVTVTGSARAGGAAARAPPAAVDVDGQADEHEPHSGGLQRRERFAEEQRAARESRTGISNPNGATSAVG